jgi:hypothetical protein
MTECQLFLRGEDMLTRTSRNTQHRHILAVRDRAWLDSHFTGRWNGRKGPTKWPPRSPQLNLCDFTVLEGPKQLLNYQNQEYIIIWTRLEIPSAMFAFSSYGEVLSMSSRLQKCVCACVRTILWPIMTPNIKFWCKIDHAHSASHLRKFFTLFWLYTTQKKISESISIFICPSSNQ